MLIKMLSFKKSKQTDNWGLSFSFTVSRVPGEPSLHLILCGFNRRASPSVLCFLDHFVLLVEKLQTKPYMPGLKITLSPCDIRVNRTPVSLNNWVEMSD